MKHLVWLLLTWVPMLGGAAGGTGEPVDARTVYRHETIEVRADGTSSDTLEHAELLITDKAAREYAQVTLGYKPTLADFEVVEAYTLKKDGRRIAVPASMIHVQRGRVAGISAASFDDSASAIIIFPDTAAGDTTVYKARWSGKKNLLPPHFWLWRSFQPTWLVDDYRLTVSAPTTYPLHVRTLEMAPPREHAAQGRRAWTWHHRNGQRAPHERAAPHPSQHGPRFFVSSLPDYATMAREQHKLWHDKTRLTPQLRALAAELARGKQTDEEKARRIYDWVRESIKYVALSLDTGGWEPHRAQDILERGSGDCKDHAVLLEALLAAVGIDSTPALIHTGELRQALEPPQAEFNHVITYLPSLDVYLDSTETHAPFGVLPTEDRSRPVLHLRGATAGLHRTPGDDEDSDVLVSRTRYVLHADGSVDAEQTLTADGSRQIELRRWYGGFNEYQKKNWIRDRLIAEGVVGEGDVSAIDVAGEGFEVRLAFHAANYFNPAGAVAIDASAWHPFSPLLGSFGKYARAERATPYACGSYRERQEITMVFPPTWRPALPAAQDYTAPDRSFRVSYRRDGDQVVVKREYVSAVRGDVCAASRYLAEKPFFENVMRDLRSQILFSAPAPAAVPGFSGRAP